MSASDSDKTDPAFATILQASSQDLLDYVTYAGGVGRRRADAVSGVGASALLIWGPP